MIRWNCKLLFSISTPDQVHWVRFPELKSRNAKYLQISFDKVWILWFFLGILVSETVWLMLLLLLREKQSSSFAESSMCSNYCLHSSGMWSRYPPLQSSANQCFLQKFKRLFSNKKPETGSPRGWSVLKCREFEGQFRWNEFCTFHEITGFTLALLEEVRTTVNREFSWGQIWSYDRRHNFTENHPIPNSIWVQFSQHSNFSAHLFSIAAFSVITSSPLH